MRRLPSRLVVDDINRDVGLRRLESFQLKSVNVRQNFRYCGVNYLTVWDYFRLRLPFEIYKY